MREILANLFVGGEGDCQPARPGRGVVHACKYPCHARAVGYRGSLRKDHPQYLAYEHGGNLYLNLIDPPVPLFQLASFTTYLEFAERVWFEGGELLIHCNQGHSRAPALALLLLARVPSGRGCLDNVFYDQAVLEFDARFPHCYQPGQGIQLFLREHWGQLLGYGRG